MKFLKLLSVIIFASVFLSGCEEEVVVDSRSIETVYWELDATNYPSEVGDIYITKYDSEGKFYSDVPEKSTNLSDVDITFKTRDIFNTIDAIYLRLVFRRKDTGKIINVEEVKVLKEDVASNGYPNTFTGANPPDGFDEADEFIGADISLKNPVKLQKARDLENVNLYVSILKVVVFK